MKQYQFHTVWKVQACAPLVWQVILRSERWPEWWPCVREVRPLVRPNADTDTPKYQCTIRSPLAYELTFVVDVVEQRDDYYVRGLSQGTLVGWGSWQVIPLSKDVSALHCIWEVETTVVWMNLTAPLLAPLFRWAHQWVMNRGERGLKEYLSQLQGQIPEVFKALKNESPAD